MTSTTFGTQCRIKSLDFHPEKPSWILLSLFNGTVAIFDQVAFKIVKSFDVTNLPVRAAKFIARKQWIVCGSDDCLVTIFNYNTGTKIAQYLAHADFIRSIAVHPTQNIFLTASDDKTIRMWEFEDSGPVIHRKEPPFQGHKDFIMQVAFNPNDPEVFASASMDKTIKLWRLGNYLPSLSLSGHSEGVNCCAFFTSPKYPYLASGSDDNSVIVWDLHTKSIIATLKGHTDNVMGVAVSPDEPVIITASEDGSVRVWDATTFRQIRMLFPLLDKAWAVECQPQSHACSIAFDTGLYTFSLGSATPAVDISKNGLVYFANQTIINRYNVVKISSPFSDGDVLPLTKVKHKVVDHRPSDISFSPSGNEVSLLSKRRGEYSIRNTRNMENRTFGEAIDFVWCTIPHKRVPYAILQNDLSVHILFDFDSKNAISFRPSFDVQHLFPGPVLTVAGDDEVCFFSWDQGELLSSIEISNVQTVCWSTIGLLAIISDTSFFILHYSPGAESPFTIWYSQTFENSTAESFRISSLTWAEPSLLYIETQKNENKLQVLTIGPPNQNKTLQDECILEADPLFSSNYTIFTLSRVPSNSVLLPHRKSSKLRSRVYLFDQNESVRPYTLQSSLNNFESAILNGDINTAKSFAKTIPHKYSTRCASLLLSQGYPKQALAVSRDPKQKFKMAFDMKETDVCFKILSDAADPEALQKQWTKLGTTCLAQNMIPRAIYCFENAKDFSSLLLIYSSINHRKGLKALAQKARDAKQLNIALICYNLVQDAPSIVSMLAENGHKTESEIFSSTYIPGTVDTVADTGTDTGTAVDTATDTSTATVTATETE